jgi:hypothetical protein
MFSESLPTIEKIVYVVCAQQITSGVIRYITKEIEVEKMKIECETEKLKGKIKMIEILAKAQGRSQ